jgi:N-acyl-D-amino-acid deacylase
MQLRFLIWLQLSACWIDCCCGSASGRIADEMTSLRTTLYDLMLESDATSMLMLPFYNYFYGNHDAIREMLTHPAGRGGLSDGGAHCGMICDASYPTFLLTHWARDRHGGEKLPLEYVVRKQSHDTAQVFGLSDRGVVEVGKRADVNVIDLDALTLHPARMAYDLPAGGQRLVQGASGYTATIVSGVVTLRGGVDTARGPAGWSAGPADRRQISTGALGRGSRCRAG